MPLLLLFHASFFIPSYNPPALISSKTAVLHFHFLIYFIFSYIILPIRQYHLPCLCTLQLIGFPFLTIFWSFSFPLFLQHCLISCYTSSNILHSHPGPHFKAFQVIYLCPPSDPCSLCFRHCSSITLVKHSICQ